MMTGTSLLSPHYSEHLSITFSVDWAPEQTYCGAIVPPGHRTDSFHQPFCHKLIWVLRPTTSSVQPPKRTISSDISPTIFSAVDSDAIAPFCFNVIIALNELKTEKNENENETTTQQFILFARLLVGSLVALLVYSKCIFRRFCGKKFIKLFVVRRTAVFLVLNSTSDNC